MKQRLIELAARIDALSLRERAMVFAAALAVVGFIGNTLVLAPMQATQQALRTQIGASRDGMAEIDNAIAGRVQAAQVDPDAPARARLNAVLQETGQLGKELLALEHGLVPPERMAPLVDAILRANGRLKLVSMQTLPAEPLTAPKDAGAPANAAPATAAERTAAAEAAAVAEASASVGGPAPVPLLYRHGVEVTVSGNYLDMVDYMSALEALPTRMFWGRARLEVETYPAARLTLTLHTLSLDRQWMKL